MNSYKQWRINLEVYLKSHIDELIINEILNYCDYLNDGFIRTLKRFESLLKIDGINSKSMVLNDIQYLLKGGNNKDGNTK